MLGDQQQAAVWAPPEKVITKKTGWRRCEGLTREEWNGCRRRLCSAVISEASVAAEQRQQWLFHNGLHLYCWKRPITEHPRHGSLNDARSTLLLFNTMLSHPELWDNPRPAQNRNIEQKWTWPEKGKMVRVQPSCCKHQITDCRGISASTCRHQHPWPYTRQGSNKRRESTSKPGCYWQILMFWIML